MEQPPLLVLGVRFDVITLPVAEDRIARWFSEPSSRLVVTPNPETVMLARRDSALARALAAADLSVPDGVGIVWAARRLGHPLPARVPGIELAQAALQRAALMGVPVFLVGGRPQVAAEAAARCQARWPALVVAGHHHGYFTAAEEPGMVAAIATSGARLVLVGMGTPRQELFAQGLRREPGGRVVMTVGGTLDVWSGRARRAPPLVRRAGLEWLYRAVREPRRLGRLAALPRFAWAIFDSTLRQHTP